MVLRNRHIDKDPFMPADHARASGPVPRVKARTLNHGCSWFYKLSNLCPGFSSVTKSFLLQTACIQAYFSMLILEDSCMSPLGNLGPPQHQDTWFYRLCSNPKPWAVKEG